MTRPLCECHGEPMHRMGTTEKNLQRWFCAIRNRERRLEFWDSLSGVEYNAELLRNRRRKALARMKRREEQRGPLPREGRD